MNHDELAGLYAGGAARLAPDILTGAGLDAHACAWLLDPGLPMRPDPAVALVEFVPPAIHLSPGGAMLVFAREPWADALWLAIAADGRVVAAGEDAAPLFVNTRVEHFLHFLAALQRFQAEASRHHPGPRVYSQSEMQARLDALRRGEFVRRHQPAAGSEPPSFDRPAALRQLDRTWEQHDAKALRRGGWWCRIREQLRDGLL
ncbi:SUKH-4 family immunity protein [Achromobacter xylosoxidans]